MSISSDSFHSTHLSLSHSIAISLSHNNHHSDLQHSWNFFKRAIRSFWGSTSIHPISMIVYTDDIFLSSSIKKYPSVVVRLFQECFTLHGMPTAEMNLGMNITCGLDGNITFSLQKYVESLMDKIALSLCTPSHPHFSKASTDAMLYENGSSDSHLLVAVCYQQHSSTLVQLQFAVSRFARLIVGSRRPFNTC